jgi:hypothetical protein
MIWLSVNRDFFISVDPFLWKKFYFSALRNFGGITSFAGLEVEHFRVLVFVGASQSKLAFETAAAVQKLGARAEYVKIAGNGSNALDFHIAFHLGHLAAQDPTAFFHIISKDTGFDPLIQHLKERKVFVSRFKDVTDIPLLKNSWLLECVYISMA